MKKDNKTGEVVFLVTFMRLPNQTPMEEVLARPWSDEVEDYAEYKRLRQLAKEEKPGLKPAVTVQTDGPVDEVLDVDSDSDEPLFSAAYLQ